MSDMRIDANQLAPARQTGDSKWLAWRGTRDGAGFVADWIQALILEGRGYGVTVGAFSTPIQGGGAGTILDADQPEFIISVPSGTSILPFSVRVQCQIALLAADSEEAEILLAVDKAAAWDATGTATTETPANLLTANSNASGCTARSAFTANITTVPVLAIELARKVLLGDFHGTPANGMWTPLDLNYEPRAIPIIQGPAMLVGYWGGTVAATGFAQIQWVELPSNAFS